MLFPTCSSKGNFHGHRAGLQSVAFAPDDRTLVSVDDLGIAHLWDTSSGAYDTIATGQDRIWCVAFSANRHTFATTSRDASVKLWDLERKRGRFTIAGHPQFLYSMAFSAFGNTLCVADQAGNCWTYDTTQRRSIETRQFNLGKPVVVSMLSRDAAWLATADRDQNIAIWDFESGHQIQNFTATLRPLYALWISQVGRFVAMGGKDGVISVREMVSGSEKQFVACDTSDLKFCPQEECLAYSCWGHGRPIVWDFATGQSRSAQGLGHQGGTIFLAVSADGQTIATGGKDKTIILWNCHTLQEFARLSGHTADVCSVAFSPRGRTLAFGCGDRTVRLWDVASQQELTVLRGHAGAVSQVVFSPDGLTIASLADLAGGESEVFLWSAR